jgi:glycosyltransferase involved in cell wall biosynthesis
MTGTPSVSTPVGVEGLDLKHGEHVLVANDPASFAEAVVRLLGDEELWQHLALQGRLHVTAHHSREAIRSQFMEAVTNALAREPKRWPESVGNENIRP